MACVLCLPILSPRGSPMKPSFHLLLVLLGTLPSLPRAVSAQPSGAAVDLAVLAGSRIGGEFVDRQGLGLGIAVASGTSSVRRVSVGVSADVMGAPHGDRCVLNGAGHCIPSYPSVLSVALEVRHDTRLMSHLNVELLGMLGAGWFVDPFWRALLVGGGVRVVGRVTSHVSMVTSVRGLVAPNTAAGALLIVPVTVGIRLQ